MRQRVAAEAARIMAEQGFLDYAGARRKAVARLRIADRRQWPDNAEIARALEEYRALFQSDEQPKTLERLRSAAVEAMELLGEFSPHLVGAVRDGSAGEHSKVILHLMADTAKTVAIGLLDRRIHHEVTEARLRFPGGVAGQRPAMRFVLGDVDIEAVVLEPADRSHPPLDPVSGKPDRGLAVGQVRALLRDQSRSEIGT